MKEKWGNTENWEKKQKLPKKLDQRLTRRKFLLELGGATLGLIGGLIGANKIIKELNLKKEEEYKKAEREREIENIKNNLKDLNDKEFENLVVECVKKIQSLNLEEYKKVNEEIKTILDKDEKKIRNKIREISKITKLEELKTRREELIRYSNIKLTNIRIKLRETRETYINTYEEAYAKLVKILRIEKENREYYNKMIQSNVYILYLFKEARQEITKKIDPLNINLQIRALTLEDEIQNAIDDLDRKIEELQNKNKN